MRKHKNIEQALHERVMENEASKRVTQAEAEARKQEIKRKAEAKKKRNLITRIIIGVVTFFVVTVTMSILIYKLFFVIDTLTVSECQHYSAQEVIESSGVNIGDNLFSFSHETVENRLKKKLTYVKSLEIERNIPDEIVFNVTEYDPKYYSHIYGDTYVLSVDMIVLERIEGEEKNEDLCMLKLPAVSEAICGEEVKFRSESAENHIKTVCMKLFESSMFDKITVVDFTDEYDISFDYERRVRLNLGAFTDCEIKIRLAEKVMQDEMFESTNKFSVELSDTAKTIAAVDNTLEFD